MCATVGLQASAHHVACPPPSQRYQFVLAMTLSRGRGNLAMWSARVVALDLDE